MKIVWSLPEDEAKKKWCHRTYNDGGDAERDMRRDNELVPGDWRGAQESLCIGSHCIAWRGTGGGHGVCVFVLPPEALSKLAESEFV